MSSRNTKLVLETETIREITNEQLGAIAGGDMTLGGIGGIPVPTPTASATGPGTLSGGGVHVGTTFSRVGGTDGTL